MKHALLAATVALALSGGAAVAHPGGLNSEGCHNDRKNKTFHCHHAQPQANYAVPQQKAAPRRGNVTKVVDGDTIHLGKTKIRLRGIDAPEMSQMCNTNGKKWKCGEWARNQLSRLLAGRTVSCEAVEKDRHGRTVARCTADGYDIAQWMVRNGIAVAYTKYSMAYVSDESAARAAGAGIWSSQFQMPWDYRKN